MRHQIIMPQIRQILRKSPFFKQKGHFEKVTTVDRKLHVEKREIVQNKNDRS